MNKARRDVLKTVTETYYERKKLQSELSLNPPKDETARIEKQLKLEELTAKLDYLTGGWFKGTSGRRARKK